MDVEKARKITALSQSLANVEEALKKIEAVRAGEPKFEQSNIGINYYQPGGGYRQTHNISTTFLQVETLLVAEERRLIGIRVGIIQQLVGLGVIV